MTYIDTDEITRVEVIDYSRGGRAYTNMNVGLLDIQIQDDGKTLKVFVLEVTQ